VNANIDLRNLLSDRNPFSSRATRPGALRYQFLNGTTMESLVSSLQGENWWGEIIGPHGSGKSTLLRCLEDPLGAAGRTLHQYTMHSGEKRIAIAGTDLKKWNESSLVIVDGYEQLGGWNRSMLKKICRQQGAGLLITAHEPMGFATIFQTAVTMDLAKSLVNRLLPPDCPLIQEQDVTNSVNRWQGNLREVFFELYDLYELRRTG
jgi:hypothetical protein